ncbi:Rtf2 RING-finger, putative [Trypanosoma equiperdum]|uniref:Replication termination factor 2 n=2 Tax=Trypanozoon TaxID=39700 RepID=Q388D9_TRYB2|nr:hypothetical protein, conserved [Trypanosoma brucei brucei TREU927]EAN78831.1 hypothetical protein, conserved [Trypanosoma brucei brucei TREU927]SCU68236.1 Rtf2 RING-finger, putative [Trypanosoma equiperdum]
MGGDGQALSNKRRILEKSRVFLTADELRKGDNGGGETTRKLKEEKVLRWSHCGLSLEPLQLPVVFDLYGRLYSKKAVLDNILEKRSLHKQSSSDLNSDMKISKLSDVCEVSNVEEGKDRKVLIRCPVTGYDSASGLHQFLGFWSCGHVVACAAVNESVGKPAAAKKDCPVDDDPASVCPFCGATSFAVHLILDQESDEVKQYRRLRSLHRVFRKRGRSNT